MPATKISDLLPIPDSVVDPHPYQVFGLEDGEQEVATIHRAIQSVVTKLKSVKDETDPKLWSRAAKLVQQSRMTLANAESKAQLDARFGIIAAADESTSDEDPLAEVLPTTDPLANLLPSVDPLATATPETTADPLAAILPSADPSRPETSHPPIPEAVAAQVGVPPSNPMPAGVFGTPEVEPNSPVSPASNGPPVLVAVEDHIQTGSVRGRTRKKPILGMLMFGTFTTGMLAVIGTLIYFLVFGSGKVAITNSDGQLTISTEPASEDDKQIVAKPLAENSVRPQPQPLDPVMGTLAESRPPASRPDDPSGLANQMQNKPSTTEDSTETTTSESDGGEPANMTDADMAAPATTSDDPQPEPTPEPTPEPAMTDEMIANADQKISELQALIKQADWTQMKPTAEAVTEMRMTEEQQELSEALYELVDLATYYRGGIEKAVGDLSVGNDFAVTDDFRVIVVEKGEDLLVVQYNKKNRSFTFNEFPFSLAHKLATFSIAASPTREAAKAVYQAIAPKATEDYRKESITQLRNIRGEVEGADPARLADTIERLFNEGS